MNPPIPSAADEKSYAHEEEPLYAEIECQLDEILLQVCCGVPEEHIMRSIGIPLSIWHDYKMNCLIGSTRIQPLFRLSLMHRADYLNKRRFRGALFKTSRSDCQHAP